MRNRLASYYYFRDRSALNAAVGVALAHRSRIDVELVRRWTLREASGSGEEARIVRMLHEFLDRLA